MSLPRILVIGRNGQVGWELCRTLAPLGAITAVDVPEIDLTAPDSIRRWIDETRPQAILNAAAYTAVDKAESEADLAMKVNGVAPGILAEEARRHAAWLVHYSTDYVYNGTKAAAYVEEDAPDPLSAYGRTKAEGDRAIQAVGGAYLIFRLCWVYGGRGHNFLRTILRLARERAELRVVADQIGCPTWSRMIAEATAQALAKVLAGGDPARFCGIYHLASSGATSWHGFAKAIVERVPDTKRACRTVQAISTSEYPLPARRPANSVLNCDKLERTFALRLPAWEDSLRQVFEAPINGFESLVAAP